MKSFFWRRKKKAEPEGLPKGLFEDSPEDDFTIERPEPGEVEAPQSTSQETERDLSEAEPVLIKPDIDAIPSEESVEAREEPPMETEEAPTETEEPPQPSIEEPEPDLDFLAKEKPKKGKTIIIAGIAVAVLLIIAGVVYFAFFRNTTVPVTATLILRGSILEVVNSTGKVEPNAMIPVSAPATDKVTDVFVKESDTVTKGQALLRLEAHGNILSPSDGSVVDLTAQAGQQVTGPLTATTPSANLAVPGAMTSGTATTGGLPSTLMTIADTSTMYVVASVDETDIAKIKVNQNAEIILDAYPSKKIKGKVTEIGIVATATQTGGTTFPVKIQVTEAKDVTMRIGMSADCNIILTTKKDAIRLPVQAVTTVDASDVVYVVKENYAEKTKVKIGLLSGDYYEVLGGVVEGDEVVIKGTDKLKGEQKVKVKVTRR